MNVLRISKLLSFAILTSVTVAAQVCVPPPGFVDTPRPAIANANELVSHTEEITLDRSRGKVLEESNKPLKDTIHKTSSLPGVSVEIGRASCRERVSSPV